jgi:hypothetical protein
MMGKTLVHCTTGNYLFKRVSSKIYAHQLLVGQWWLFVAIPRFEASANGQVVVVLLE